jgi:hypothetical protein
VGNTIIRQLLQEKEEEGEDKDKVEWIFYLFITTQRMKRRRKRKRRMRSITSQPLDRLTFLFWATHSHRGRGRATNSSSSATTTAVGCRSLVAWIVMTEGWRREIPLTLLADLHPQSTKEREEKEERTQGSSLLALVWEGIVLFTILLSLLREEDSRITKVPLFSPPPL